MSCHHLTRRLNKRGPVLHSSVVWAEIIRHKGFHSQTQRPYSLPVSWRWVGDPAWPLFLCSRHTDTCTYQLCASHFINSLVAFYFLRPKPIRASALITLTGGPVAQQRCRHDDGITGGEIAALGHGYAAFIEVRLRRLSNAVRVEKAGKWLAWISSFKKVGVAKNWCSSLSSPRTCWFCIHTYEPITRNTGVRSSR